MTPAVAVIVAILSTIFVPAPAPAPVMGITEKPSVYLAYGEQAWTRPEFDFTLHGGSATLLALPVDAYDCVLLFPFGYAADGDHFEFEQALRFTESLDGIRKLLTLQTMLDRLHAKGTPRSKIKVYLPGFFSTNAAAWDRSLRPEQYQPDVVGPDGTVYHRETFEERLWRLLRYFRTPTGEARCVLAWDASGDMQSPASLSALAIGHAMRWNFDCETEAHPHPGSALQSLPSITTAWMMLESPESYTYPLAIRAVLCNNSSGIGRAGGVYQPGQPIGRFGRDHRRNYVPDWRRQGRCIYIEVFAFARDGSPPAFWSGDIINP